MPVRLAARFNILSRRPGKKRGGLDAGLRMLPVLADVSGPSAVVRAVPGEMLWLRFAVTGAGAVAVIVRAVLAVVGGCGYDLLSVPWL